MYPGHCPKIYTGCAFSTRDSHGHEAVAASGNSIDAINVIAMAKTVKKLYILLNIYAKQMATMYNYTVVTAI